MTRLDGFRPNPESRGDYTMRFWTLLPKLRLYNMTPVVQPGYLNSGFVNYRPTGLALTCTSRNFTRYAQRHENHAPAVAYLPADEVLRSIRYDGKALGRPVGSVGQQVDLGHRGRLFGRTNRRRGVVRAGVCPSEHLSGSQPTEEDRE